MPSLGVACKISEHVHTQLIQNDRAEQYGMCGSAKRTCARQRQSFFAQPHMLHAQSRYIRPRMPEAQRKQSHELLLEPTQARVCSDLQALRVLGKCRCSPAKKPVLVGDTAQTQRTNLWFAYLHNAASGHKSDAARYLNGHRGWQFHTLRQKHGERTSARLFLQL
jgi:hypothetical protein